MTSRVLAITPGRGGSKGIARKNLQPIGGVPLIGLAVAAGTACSAIDTVIVSTDDRQILDAAVRFGARAPFLRTPELASDRTPMLDVLLDTVNRMAQLGEEFEYLILLQPTTPFREPEVLATAINALISRPDCDSCAAVTPVVDSHPRRLRKIREGFLVPYLEEAGDKERQQRQDHADDLAYRRCGNFYICRISSLKEKDSLYGDRCLPWIVEGAAAITIDDPYDLLLASAVWERDQADPAVSAMRQILSAQSQRIEPPRPQI